jgi:hypothetical protein
MSDRGILSKIMNRALSTLPFLALCLLLTLAGAPGCDNSGTVAVSKQSRARLASDANAEGKVDLPKTKNRRKPVAGLRTARGMLDKNKKVE